MHVNKPLPALRDSSRYSQSKSFAEVSDRKHHFCTLLFVCLFKSFGCLLFFFANFRFIGDRQHARMC